MLGAKSLEGVWRDQGVMGHLPEGLDCIHHIAGGDSLAEEGSHRHN